MRGEVCGRIKIKERGNGDRKRGIHTERGEECDITSSSPLSLAPLLHFSPRRRKHSFSLSSFSARGKKGAGPQWKEKEGKKTDRMNNSFLNMASIVDFDPLNPSIPATKVEITVSCR